MFEDLRKQEGLTRQALADKTRRSVGYILKAEQATFPSPPVALLSYYAARGHSEEVLRSAYRDYQRRQRRTWLDMWTPLSYTAGRPFRQKWTRINSDWRGDGLIDSTGLRDGGTGVGAFQFQTGISDNSWFNSYVIQYPSSYALSTGLCLPAAVVYRNDKDLTKAGSIRTAMGDLLEYYESGEGLAGNFDWEANAKRVSNLRRIAVEEGMELNDRAAPAA